VTKNEENTLMGIDFIKTEKGYVVLEANPSPGWSAYHECNGIENDSFIDDLLEELKYV
jgi:glutathione synthase/RimK-type ligase-like ATP-grasp enzyme